MPHVIGSGKSKCRPGPIVPVVFATNQNRRRRAAHSSGPLAPHTSQYPNSAFRAAAVGNASFFFRMASCPESFTRRASVPLNSVFA